MSPGYLELILPTCRVAKIRLKYQVDGLPHATPTAAAKAVGVTAGDTSAATVQGLRWMDSGVSKGVCSCLGVVNEIVCVAP